MSIISDYVYRKKEKPNRSGTRRRGSIVKSKIYKNACGSCSRPIVWKDRVPLNSDGTNHMLSCIYVCARRKAEIREESRQKKNYIKLSKTNILTNKVIFDKIS